MDNTYSKRGSSSSSNSYNDRYDSKSEDKSHSRRPVDNERDKKRQKSRWDDDRSSGRNGGGKDKEYKRNRSRSPVSLKYSNREHDKPTEIKTPKKASNWSDSSSEDEDTRKVKRDRVNGQEENNLNFQNVEEFKIGSAGLDLGYQREDIQLLLPVPEVRSNNNNDNNWKLDSHSSYQHKAISLPVLPPPPSTKSTTTAVGIQMKMLPSVTKPSTKSDSLKPKSMKIASVFSIDDDDEEEMPAECKMRMKNIGRETPTSAGPNSFGKTKMGFCNVTTIKERELEEELAKKK